MQSDSGYNLPPLKPVPELTPAEAIAQVDAWSADEGMDFRLHKIARALRAEVARLETEVARLNDALLDEFINSERRE